MTDNIYAKSIRITGFAVIVLGVIGSFILGSVFEVDIPYSSYDEYNWTLVLIGIISSFIVGLLFVGLGELIDLLQANYDKQYDILKEIKTISKNMTENDK